MPSVRNREADLQGWKGKLGVFFGEGGDLNREVFTWFLKRIHLIFTDTAQQTHARTRTHPEPAQSPGSVCCVRGPQGASQLTGTWTGRGCGSPVSCFWATGSCGERGRSESEFPGLQQSLGESVLGIQAGAAGGGDTYCGCNYRSSFPKAAAKNPALGAAAASVYNKHPHLSGLRRFL